MTAQELITALTDVDPNTSVSVYATETEDGSGVVEITGIDPYAETIALATATPLTTEP